MPSYEKRQPSGLWSVRFREIDPSTGESSNKRLSGFKTKRDAQYAYEDYVTAKKTAAEAMISNEPITDSSAMTFAVLFAEYLRYKQSRVKATSFYDIEKKLTLRILPFFGEMQIKDITPLTILEWQNTLSEYSYAYRKDLMTHLTSIYNYAERYHDIKNVAKRAEKPRNLEAKKEMLFWTPEEFAAAVSTVEQPGYAMLFRFLFLTGCRKGEALALTWKDVDLTSGAVHICKSVSNKVRANGKWYSITTPKNVGSDRTVYLPSFFCKMLKAYKEEQATAGPFLFGGEDPFPHITIDRRFHQAADAAGVKRIRIHDLRHSCASLLIHKGVSIVAVSRHLGHSSVKQTLDTYSHMLPDDQTMILKSLSSLEGEIGTN